MTFTSKRTSPTMHLWDRVNAATGQPVPSKASIIVLSVIFASVVIAFSGSFTQGLDFTYFEPLLSPIIGSSTQWSARPTEYTHATNGSSFTILPRPPGQWQPIPNLLYKIAYIAPGSTLADSALFIHAVPVLLHAATAVLLGAFAMYLFGELRAAIFTSILFGLHPIHADTIASAMEYGRIVSTLFLLGSVWQYLRACPKQGPIQYRSYCWAVALALFASASHSSGFSAFPLLLVLDLFVTRWDTVLGPYLVKKNTVVTQEVKKAAPLSLRELQKLQKSSPHGSSPGLKHPPAPAVVDTAGLLSTQQASDAPAQKAPTAAPKKSKKASEPSSLGQYILLKMAAVDPVTAFAARTLILSTLAAYAWHQHDVTVGPSGGIPSIHENPVPYSPDILTRLMTNGYLTARQLLFLIVPYPLSCSWLADTVPLVDSLLDYRNVVTFVVGYGIKCVLKLVYTMSLATGDTDDSQPLTDRDVYLLSVSVFFLGLLSAAPILTSHPFMLSQSAMYLSSAGFCLLLGFGVRVFGCWLEESSSVIDARFASPVAPGTPPTKHTKASVLIKHAAVLISLLIAAGSGVLTSRRVEAWADPLYLEALSIVSNPGDSMAWILLGRRQLDAVGGDPSKIYNNATVGVTWAIVDQLVVDSMVEIHSDRFTYGYQLERDRLMGLTGPLPCSNPTSPEQILNLTTLELTTCALANRPYFPPALDHVATIADQALQQRNRSEGLYSIITRMLESLETASLSRFTPIHPEDLSAYAIANFLTAELRRTGAMEDALKLGTPADKYSEDPSLTIILTELHDRAVGLLGQHPLLILQQLTGRHLQSRNVPLPYAAKYFELGRKMFPARDTIVVDYANYLLRFNNPLLALDVINSALATPELANAAHIHFAQAKVSLEMVDYQYKLVHPDGSAAGNHVNFKQSFGGLAVSSLDAVAAGLPRKFEATEAEPGFRKAVQLDSKNGNFHLGLAQYLHTHSSNKTEAIEHYREALLYLPGNQECRLNLGLLLFEAGNYTSALPYLQQFVLFNLDNIAMAYDLMAKSYIGLNNTAEATVWLQKDLAKCPFPDTLLLRRTLASVYKSAGRLGDAKAQVDIVLAAVPGDAWADEMSQLIKAGLAGVSEEDFLRARAARQQGSAQQSQQQFQQQQQQPVQPSTGRPGRQLDPAQEAILDAATAGVQFTSSGSDSQSALQRILEREKARKASMQGQSQQTPNQQQQQPIQQQQSVQPQQQQSVQPQQQQSVQQQQQQPPLVQQQQQSPIGQQQQPPVVQQQQPAAGGGFSSGSPASNLSPLQQALLKARSQAAGSQQQQQAPPVQQQQAPPVQQQAAPVQQQPPAQAAQQAQQPAQKSSLSALQELLQKEKAKRGKK